jgi:hypothetical protein
MAGFSENHKRSQNAKIAVFVHRIDDFTMDAGVQRGAPTLVAEQKTTPATQRRGIDGAPKLGAAAPATPNYAATVTVAAVDGFGSSRKVTSLTAPVLVVLTPFNLESTRGACFC